jgi:pimeloyl-ACP methyl ester carboxylesterase
VVKRARRGGRKVILGGHSLGASTAVAYAAWDFKGRPGFRDLSGLVLIDGGLLGTLAPPKLADVKQRAAALRQGDPFLDLLGIGVPWAAGVFSDLAGLYAKVLPDARATFIDYPAIPAALKAPVPATNEGALGYAFDESTSPAVLSLIHVRAGALAASGDPRPWQNGEVTPIENVAKLFGRSPVDAAEWYFPQRLSLDVQAAGPLSRNAAANFLHLREWHKRGIDVPLYAIQTSLSRGRVLRGARRLVAVSRIPARKVKLVNAAGVNSHLDPLTSAPGKSRFLKTVIPWLK